MGMNVSGNPSVNVFPIFFSERSTKKKTMEN